jgi:predicted SAM-dependent methyltransferase
MKLNVGCGAYPARGWVNVDRYPQEAATDGHYSFAVVDITTLPFRDGEAELIYAGHVLEHLTYDDELPRALAEIRRVLAEEGQLMVVGPDIDRATRGRYNEETVRGIWPGATIPNMPGAEHQWEPTVWAHERALVAAGFAAEEVPIHHVTRDWPVVSYVGWQLAFTCSKRDAE